MAMPLQAEPGGFSGAAGPRSRAGAFLGLLCLLAALPGCTSRVLRQSFNDYGDAYAETQNRQLLLNLARLH
jgi:hypothetical protein